MSGLEEDRAHQLLTGSPVARDVDVRTWQEDESPYSKLIQGLKDRGVTSGRLGLEETIEFVFADAIARAGAPHFRSSAPHQLQRVAA